MVHSFIYSFIHMSNVYSVPALCQSNIVGAMTDFSMGLSSGPEKYVVRSIAWVGKW